MNSPAGVNELFLKLIREKSFKIQEAYRRIASGHAQYDQRAAEDPKIVDAIHLLQHRK
jgi:hypothetical protein